MEKKNYFDRFKKLSKADWVVIGLMSALLIFALYMCIGFSVKLGQGLTLFGDSNAYTNNTVESSGPTGADISVLILYWVLTAMLAATDVYVIFFKKPSEKPAVHKEIVDGRTVIVKEDKDDAQK